MARSHHAPAALQFLANRPLTPASTLGLRLVVLLVAWGERRRTRRALRRLDDHMIKDIGLTRWMVEREATRPFWEGAAPRRR